MLVVFAGAETQARSGQPEMDAHSVPLQQTPAQVSAQRLWCSPGSSSRSAKTTASVRREPPSDAVQPLGSAEPSHLGRSVCRRRGTSGGTSCVAQGRFCLEVDGLCCLWRCEGGGCVPDRPAGLRLPAGGVLWSSLALLSGQIGKDVDLIS